MSKKVFKSPSQLSSLQNFTALVSELQRLFQTLLDDASQADTSKGSASTPEQAAPEPQE